MTIEDNIKESDKPTERLYQATCMGVPPDISKHIYTTKQQLPEKSTGLCDNCYRIYVTRYDGKK